MRKWALVLSVWVVLCGCGGGGGAAPTLSADTPRLTVISSAFREGEMIPAKYTCDGEDVSPPLAWSGAPADTVALALIANDPDAPVGDWVHWVWYDLPATVDSLPEAIQAGQPLPGGGSQGVSSFRKQGYGGPCPPSGVHRYYFTLYALDQPTSLPAGTTRQEVLQAMEGHILASGQLIGRYKKD